LPGKSGEPIESFFVLTFVIFGVSLAGWLIAIPLILMVNDVSRWRFWLYLGIGSSIGPALAYQGIVLPFLKSYQGRYDQTPAVLVMVGISAIISCIAALSYLLLLRRAQTSKLRRMNVTAGDH
jgi:hypothetical protein